MSRRQVPDAKRRCWFTRAARPILVRLSMLGRSRGDILSFRLASRVKSLSYRARHYQVIQLRPRAFCADESRVINHVDINPRQPSIMPSHHAITSCHHIMPSFPDKDRCSMTISPEQVTLPDNPLSSATVSATAYSSHRRRRAGPPCSASPPRRPSAPRSSRQCPRPSPPAAAGRAPCTRPP